jgi:hypothetical protein
VSPGNGLPRLRGRWGSSQSCPPALLLGYLAPGWTQEGPYAGEQVLGISRPPPPLRGPASYLFLSSVHCWARSSSRDKRRQRPWAGSPQAVSSTCVVSGLFWGSMPLP